MILDFLSPVRLNKPVILLPVTFFKASSHIILEILSFYNNYFWILRTESNLFLRLIKPSIYTRFSFMKLHTIDNIIIIYQKQKSACQVFHAPFDVKLYDMSLTIVQPVLITICVNMPE